MTKHTQKIAVGLGIALHLMISACATPTKMAYSDETNTTVAPQNSVFLLTATLKNAYHPSHQPIMLVVNVEKPGATQKSDRLNFRIDKQAKLSEKSSAEEGNSYLLRMELPPGSYEIVGFTCMSSGFPNAFFFAPLHEDLTVSGPGVFYLGHVEARVRERTGNEFKAGPSIPLIDQAIGGASGGTFEVEISDRWESEELTFRTNLSKLANTSVQKAVLLPFDRDRAQIWWEKH